MFYLKVDLIYTFIYVHNALLYRMFTLEVDRNLFTKIYNMLYYTTYLYLQLLLEMMSIHFNALIDTFHHVPRNFS
jgi:hypothetical protein